MGGFGYNDGLNINYKFLGETPPQIGTPMQRLDNFDAFTKIDVPIDYYWEYKKAYNSWGNNLIWSSDSGVTTITTDKKSGIAGKGETFYIKGDWTLSYLVEQVKYAENKDLYLIEDCTNVLIIRYAFFLRYANIDSDNYSYYVFLNNNFDNDILLSTNPKLSLTPKIEQLFYDNQPTVVISNDKLNEFPDGYLTFYFPTDASIWRDVYADSYDEKNSTSPSFINVLNFSMLSDNHPKIQITEHSLDSLKQLLKSNNTFRENWLSQYQYNGTTLFNGTFIFTDKDGNIKNECTLTEIIGEFTDKYVYIDGVKRYLTTEETTYEDLVVNSNVAIEPIYNNDKIKDALNDILTNANISKLYDEYNDATHIILYEMKEAAGKIVPNSIICTYTYIKPHNTYIYNTIKSENNTEQSILILQIGNINAILRMPNEAFNIYMPWSFTNDTTKYVEYSSEFNMSGLEVDDTQDSTNKIIIVPQTAAEYGQIWYFFDLFKGKLRFNDGEYTIEELQKMFPIEE